MSPLLHVPTTRRVAALGALAALAALALPAGAGAQRVRVAEQFYFPASHNWVFRSSYPAADRLFNAFDYGHAILYEVLYAQPNAPASRLEEREYDFVTRRLLVSPPALPVVEEAVEPTYARLAPEAKAMFEWAHVLHRQLYDILGDDRLDQAARDAAVAEVLRYYRSRPDLAFSARPKSMALMEGQPYSLAFRRKYPKFNGLIWAYHWLQVGLYEPLLTAATPEERQTGVLAAVARFRQMLERPPAGMPTVMPMTAAVAPAFAERYPEAAIIFDNLHGLHDVISDVLANPEVPRGRKRAEILLAAERYRDDTSYVTTVAEWRRMALDMGVAQQGGAATDLLRPAASTAVAAQDPHAGHAGHAMPAAPAAAPARPDGARPDGASPDAHAGHAMPAAGPDNASHDSTFARLQARGQQAMGVNQYTSRHLFEALPDGGRIVLQRDSADAEGARTIRAHMREIAAAFARGDFSTPGFVHDGEVPGTRVMAARRAHLTYEARELPGGAEVRITTRDPEALRAVHAFLEYQRRDHRVGH